MVKCDVIQDLIPLYHDEVASEGSRVLIDEHIKNCAVCGEILANIKHKSVSENIGVDNIEIKALKIIKMRILKKAALIAFSSAACVAILLWIFFTWRISVPFTAAENNIEVHPPYSFYGLRGELHSNETLHIRNNYYTASFMQVGDVVYFHFTNTLFTRFFVHDGTGGWHSFGEFPFNVAERHDGFQVFVIGDNINRIYYMRGNFNRLLTDDAALAGAKENAVLIWERQ